MVISYNSILLSLQWPPLGLEGRVWAVRPGLHLLRGPELKNKTGISDNYVQIWYVKITIQTYTVLKTGTQIALQSKKFRV